MATMQTAVTIANGQTVSAAVDLGGHMLCGLLLPAAFTGTTITFQGALEAPDNSRDQNAPAAVFCAITDAAGTALSVTVAASKLVTFPPDAFAGIRQIKLVSGSAEGAARVVGLALRPAS